MRSSVRRDALILLAAVLLGVLYVASAGGNFPLDDSWIHQTYGRNLALHGEWAFLPGVASAASTSPLYTVVLSLGYSLDIPFRVWTHGLGILALALTGMIGARMAEQVLPGRKYVSLATGLALVFAWHLLWAAASGMETMIFCLLTLVLIWLGWRELQRRSQSVRALVLRGAIFGIAAALATLTRPEGVLLAGLVGLALLIVRPNMRWRGLILWGAAAVVAFLILLAPYLTFNLQVTGGLLPNTAAAKRAESAPYLARDYFWRLGNVITPLLAGGQVLLVPGMVGYALMLLGVGRVDGGKTPLSVLKNFPLLALPLIWSVALILLYAATLPLEIQHGRYLIPALPAAIVSGVIGLTWLLHKSRALLIARVLVRVTAISAVLLFVAMALVVGLRAYVFDVSLINQEMVTPAMWIRDNLPPEDLLVTHDIGAVGYFASRPLLDIAGLINPEVVPLMDDSEGMWALMRERDAKYLMALENQIPGRDPNDSRLCEVFTTSGEDALRAGGSNMTIYVIAWDGNCADSVE
jgi:hypothetical protein